MAAPETDPPVDAGGWAAAADALATDVVLVADGGGIAQATLNPVLGAKKVANLLRTFPKFGGGARIVPVLLNGAPGAKIVDVVDGYDTAISLVVEGGRITRIYAVRNPTKLGGLSVEATLSR